MRKHFTSLKILLIGLLVSSIPILTSAQGGLQYIEITNGTIDNCGDRFVDTGGVNGDYGANEDFTFTICSDGTDGNSHVELYFQGGLSLGAGDVMCFYDGIDTNANLLLCSDDPIAPAAGTAFTMQATAVNTTGCLTVTFTSDGDGNGVGWSAVIDCIKACQLVTSEIVTTDPSIMPADTGYIDLCPYEVLKLEGRGVYPQDGLIYGQSDNTSSFAWDFGDGNDALGPVVNHFYTEPGGYYIQLAILDSIGCKNGNFINQRVRVSGEPKFAITDPEPICIGDTTTLRGQSETQDSLNIVAFPADTLGFGGGLIKLDTIPLPDGVGISYFSSIEINIFSPGQTLNDLSCLEHIFWSVEHSWLFDLNVWIIAPDGTKVHLQQQTFDSGLGQVYLGEPVDNGGNNTPPGVPYTYHWTPEATLDFTNYLQANPSGTLDPNVDYASFEDLSALLGVPLNGIWQLEVRDEWGSDDGWSFGWGLQFCEEMYPDLEEFAPQIVNSYWEMAPTIVNYTQDVIDVAPPNAGTSSYTYVVEDNIGCIWEETVELEVLPPTHPDCYECLPLEVDLPDTTICLGDTIALDAPDQEASSIPITFEGFDAYLFGHGNHPPSNPFTPTLNINSLAPATIVDPFTQIDSVCIDLTSNWDADLNIFLVAPTGQKVELSTGNGGSGDNYTNTCFTTNPADPSITTGSAPFTGNYQPEGDWNTLIGAPTNGNWGLEISDGFGVQDYGLFKRWSISFVSENEITYSWSPGNAGIQNPFIQNTIAIPSETTDYLLEIEDAYGCVKNDTSFVQVVGAAAPPDVNCTPTGNGTITFTWTSVGGNSQYEYQLTVNGVPQGWVGPTTETTVIANGLLFGDEVSIEVRDFIPVGLDCGTLIATSMCEYSECAPGNVITIDEIQTTNVSCFGLSDGTATVQITNGTAPYTYQWNDPAAQVLQQASFLEAGTYTVTVTDAIFCSTEMEVTITQPEALASDISSNPTLCFDGADGNATIVPQGGTMPYTYEWSNGDTDATTTSTLSQGDYTVTITDGNGCTLENTVEVTQPATAVMATAEQTVLACYGEENNEALITAQGGTGNLHYEWSNQQSNATLTNAPDGEITYTVTDDNGCTFEGSIVLSSLDSIYGNLIIGLPSCNGVADGSIGINDFGGGNGAAGVDADYNFVWSSGHTGTTAQNIEGGQTYTVTVTDDQGCQNILSRYLAAPEPIQFNVEGTDVSCFNGNDGTATVSNINGAQGNYTILWNNNQNTATATELGAGTYSVVVTDENNCLQNGEVTLVQPSDILYSYTTKNNDCFGDSNGSISLDVEGGTPNYTYNWAPVHVQQAEESLPAGEYQLTITDANGCPKTTTIEITQPAALAVEFETDDISCHGGRDGRITAITDGGTPPFSYSLDNNEFIGSNVLIGLEAGDYNIFIRDGNGCLFFGETSVIEPEEFMVDAGPNITINLGESTEITAMSTGANGEVEYVWTPPYDSLMNCTECQTATFTPDYTANFEVYAIDENGCYDTDWVTIHVNKPRVTAVPTGFTPNGDGMNDRLLVHGLPGTKVLSFQVFDRWGELIYEATDFEVNDPNTGWDGTFRGEAMNTGVYIWKMEVEYPLDQKQEFFSGQTTIIR